MGPPALNACKQSSLPPKYWNAHRPYSRIIGTLRPDEVRDVSLPPNSARLRRLLPLELARELLDSSVVTIQNILIYADGACLNNGQPNPRAGWAFAFKPESNQPTGIVSGRLEKRGPFGDETTQTSNRAELRAVLAALRFRHWRGEGFTTLVFATDSEYVAEGATMWIRSWVRNGWKTSTGADVKNKDMWEMLLGEIKRWDNSGLKI